MTDQIEVFSGLMEKAEAAAQSFDSQGLEASMAAVMGCVAQLEQSAQASRETLTNVRNRLTQFRDSCALLHNTLHHALKGALLASENMTYSHVSTMTDAGARLRPTQPLFRRYG